MHRRLGQVHSKGTLIIANGVCVKMNRVIGIAFVSALALAGVAQAAPGDNGNGVGGCIDSLYGNATNPRPSGNGVLPSQSPGPFVNTGFNEPPRNDRVRGPSVGDANKFFMADPLNLGFSNTQDFCRTVGQFP
jgi:hypothetical protein